MPGKVSPGRAAISATLEAIPHDGAENSDSEAETHTTMDRILVTGGAGYIGSVVAELLVSRGYPTLILDNLRAGHRAAVPEGARLIEADLNDRAAIDRVFAAESIAAVVHMAAAIEVEESMRRPLFYYRENVGGTLTLLEAMLTAGVKRIVFSSTAAVYGTPRKTPITEDDPTLPVNPYGYC